MTIGPRDSEVPNQVIPHLVIQVDEAALDVIQQLPYHHMADDRSAELTLKDQASLASIGTSTTRTSSDAFLAPSFITQRGILCLFRFFFVFAVSCVRTR